MVLVMQAKINHKIIMPLTDKHLSLHNVHLTRCRGSGCHQGPEHLSVLQSAVLDLPEQELVP